MGAVSFSLDANLVRCLVQAVGLEVFVETGTYQGDSVANVLDLFGEIHSIELSGELFQKASRRFADHSFVTIYRGASAKILQQLREKLEGRAVLFWLDAHGCCGEGTAGKDFQSPLIEELLALDTLNDRSVLLIDDARYYLSPLPPESNGPEDGPCFQEVLTALQSLSRNHEIMVMDDVLLFFPASIREPIRTYAREHATDLLGIMHKTRDYDNLQTQWQEQNHIIETFQAHVDYLQNRSLVGCVMDRIRGTNRPKTQREDTE